MTGAGPAGERSEGERTAGERTAGERTGGERAARLLRWYPRAWRDRFGAEFAELLISDIEERPRSAARTLDVARGGIMARLAGVGLAGGPLPQASAGAPTAQAHRRQASASLGSLGCVLAVFVTFARPCRRGCSPSRLASPSWPARS